MATIILPEQIQSLIDADVDRLPSCCAQDDGKNKKSMRKNNGRDEECRRGHVLRVRSELVAAC
jgi:hypothetical protein